MKINVDVEYRPTPHELAQWIWDLNDEDQAALLDELGWISLPDKIMTQMSCVNNCLKCNEHDKGVWFVQKLYEYCCQKEEE